MKLQAYQISKGIFTIGVGISVIILAVGHINKPTWLIISGLFMVFIGLQIILGSFLKLEH